LAPAVALIRHIVAPSAWAGNKEREYSLRREAKWRAHRIDKSSKLGFLVKAQSERIPVLIGIKLLHTAIWLVFAGCIVAIPFTGAWRQFRWAALLTGLVLVECAVLAVNRGRCPLTDLAGRYTEERRDNFDIYLPLWLARRNKAIFGMLFIVGELFVLGRWLICRR
jgi:hypothetical protein